MGDMVFSRAERINWSSKQMDNPENRHTRHTIQTEQVTLKNMYVYTVLYVHIKTINKNRGHEFEVKERYVLAREEKKEGKMMLVY